MGAQEMLLGFDGDGGRKATSLQRRGVWIIRR